MKIIQLQFHNADHCNSQTTFKDVLREKYYARTKSRGWLISTPTGCRPETAEKVEYSVTFEVYDFSGNLLFTESNANFGEFVSPMDKALQIKDDYTKKLGLASNTEWCNWLIADKSAFSYKEDNYRWVYAESQSIPGKIAGEVNGHPLEEYSHLGLNFVVRDIGCKHKMCGKTWTEIKIFNKESEECIAVCGYLFEQGGE